MEKRFYFSQKYYVYPLLALLLLALGVEYTSSTVSGVGDPGVLLSLGVYSGLFLLIRFGIYCSIAQGQIVRTSYFFFRKKITIADIQQIGFIPTWIFANDMRTLLIRDISGQEIHMSDIAYTRAELKRVVKMLLEINPHIRVHEDVRHLLLAEGDNNKKAQ